MWSYMITKWATDCKTFVILADHFNSSTIFIFIYLFIIFTYQRPACGRSPNQKDACFNMLAFTSLITAISFLYWNWPELAIDFLWVLMYICVNICGCWYNKIMRRIHLIVLGVMRCIYLIFIVICIDLSTRHLKTSLFWSNVRILLL